MICIRYGVCIHPTKLDLHTKRLQWEHILRFSGNEMKWHSKHWHVTAARWSGNELREKSLRSEWVNRARHQNRRKKTNSDTWGGRVPSSNEVKEDEREGGGDSAVRQSACAGQICVWFDVHVCDVWDFNLWLLCGRLKRIYDWLLVGKIFQW